MSKGGDGVDGDKNGLEKEEILLLGNFGHGVIITAWTWGFLCTQLRSLSGWTRSGGLVSKPGALNARTYRHDKGNMGSKRLGFELAVDD